MGGDLLRKDFKVAVQTNLWGVSICDTEQDLGGGNNGTGGYCDSERSFTKTATACSTTILLHLMFLQNVSVM